MTSALDMILNSHPNSGIILTGDFNHFKDSFLVNQFNLKQLVNVPTRGERTLDKIYTNMNSVYRNIKIMQPVSTSDHCAVMMTPEPDMSILKPKARFFEKRSMSHNERTMFVHALKQIDWYPLYSLAKCEDQFNLFMSQIYGLMDTHMPIISCVKSSESKPWVTETFKALITRRQLAFERNDTQTYKSLRNQINRLSKRLTTKTR